MRLLVCLLAILLLATPAFADHLQADVETVVRTVGCTADVVTDDAESADASFYMGGAHTIYFGTNDRVPAELGLMILLHEVGHCLQAQEGSPLGLPARELDADRRMTALACELGLDGRSLARRLWDWARHMLGYEGDPNHGTLAQRRAASEYECPYRPEIEAP